MNDPRPPLAVTGLSALFPGSRDKAGFWRDILAGRDLIGDVPESHWLVGDYYDPDPQAEDKTYAKRGGFLSPFEFDPLEHGIPPNVVPATDTSQLLALIAAKQVLDDAIAGQFTHVDRERTSVILGATSAQELLVEMGARLQRPVWVRALREHGLPEDEVQRICDRIAQSYTPWQENTFPGLLGNVVAGRIANRLDLGGTNCITDAACASSFSALQMGANELYLGQSDLAIVGGVETFNDIFMYMCFSKTPALSPSGDCRPFAKSADGTLLGEGIAMLALRRLEDAERDGDRIYAVVRGVGSSSDGRNKSIYAPVPEGQAKALRRAYQAAGYSPASVELVEAHGTGTKAGDAAEFEGLRQVFEEAGRSDRQWCALGSVKSQIGHTKAAAGAAGLFKIVMALHHKLLPPTIKVDEPHPGLNLGQTPFFLNTRSRPWIRGAAHPRRASVSSFGFGGSNFHVAVEEYAGTGARPPRVAAWPAELLLCFEPDPQALAARCRELAERARAGASLAFLARTSHERLDPDAAARLAVVATDEADLSRKLAAAVELLEGAPDKPFATPGGVSYALGAVPGKVAFLFPGQGSQYLEMGAELAMALEPARAVWDQAAELALETPLHEVVFPRPVFSETERLALERRLTATEWAQPAIGAHSASLLAVLRRLGLEPDAVAGHSFGEVTALHAAGGLGLLEFLRVARRRGELMAEAARIPGAMLAVKASLEELRTTIPKLDGRVVVANHNAPRQVVLSGAADAIDAAASLLSERGLSARKLEVATAFHSPVVAASAEPFGDFLRTLPFLPLTTPAFSNAEAGPYPSAPDAIRTRLAEQIARPVRFVEMIDALYELGVRTFVEVGPGGVLSGLVDECLGDRRHLAVNLDRKDQHGVTSLWNGLGRLAVAGVQLDLRALLEDVARPQDSSLHKKPALSLKISGANYAKPYPPPGGSAALPKPNPPRPVGPAPVEPSASPLRSEGSPVWVQAYAEVQRQTAEAHEAYLRSTAETHTAYLKAAETSFATLRALIDPRAPLAENTLQDLTPPAAGRIEAPRPVPQVPAPALALERPMPHVEAVAPEPQPERGGRLPDLRVLLLEVVGDKTGYPIETLSLEMELESDLGIDSIKRVEILAAVQERAPGLREAKPAEMAALRTLGQVVAFFEAGAQPRGLELREAASVSLVLPRNGRSHANGEMKTLLLAVVAEKTGYPADTLSLEMELEGDLGIDSIKRVEILAALSERLPGLPEVKPAEMAALRTLGQIVARMHTATPAEAGSDEARKPAPAAVAGPLPLRFGLREQNAPALGAALAGLRTSGAVLVTDDGQGVAPALAQLLREGGIEAFVGDDVAPGTRAAICLEGLRVIESVDDAIAACRRTFEIARSLAPGLVAHGGVLVSVQDTGGDFGLRGADPVRAWLAGLPGLVKTAAREWPQAGLRAVDVERGLRSPAAVAAAIAEELLRGGGELEVGLRADGRRSTLVTELLPLLGGAASATIDEHSVIVATGGARGVTAACLLALARERRPKLALLGRTPVHEEQKALAGIEDEAGLCRALNVSERAAGRNPAPAELRAAARDVLRNREIRESLDALAKAGSHALYVTADVQDAAAVGAALEQVRRALGPITGIVHGAGVIADKRIDAKTDEQWARVFLTKVAGLRALLEATRHDPLRLVCAFSSVAGRFGNEGQADYAMANEVLGKVAAAEARVRGPECVVKALYWGPWDGGMVGAGLRAHFDHRGVPLIPLEAGARQFVRELTEADTEVEVVVTAGADPAAFDPCGGRETLLDFHVSAASHPFLDGHRVRGVVVLPVVLALEWMARAAAARRPGLVLAEIGDVRVLRGVRLTGFETGGHTLSVRCSEVASYGAAARLALRIQGEDGTLHYSAEALMTQCPPEIPAAEPVPPTAPAPWSASDVYGSRLFHAGSFQVIRSIEALDARSGAALLAGVGERGWAGGPWHVDVAALDGGLQLAILVGHRAFGEPSLPTGIGRLRLFRPAPASGNVRCRLEAKAGSALRLQADVFFEDADGRSFAELREVELHALPEHAPHAEPERTPVALS